MKDNPAIVGAHMLTLTSVVLFFDHGIDIDVTFPVGPEKYINDLLSSPKLNRFEDDWRWNFNSLISITKVRAYHHKLASVEEHVFLGDQIAGGQEILSGCNKGVSRLRNKQILLYIHESSSLSFCLF